MDFLVSVELFVIHLGIAALFHNKLAYNHNYKSVKTYIQRVDEDREIVLVINIFAMTDIIFWLWLSTSFVFVSAGLSMLKCTLVSLWGLLCWAETCTWIFFLPRWSRFLEMPLPYTAWTGLKLVQLFSDILANRKNTQNWFWAACTNYWYVIKLSKIRNLFFPSARKGNSSRMITEVELCLGIEEGCI